MMQPEHTDDLHAASSTVIQYLIRGVCQDNVQTTLSALTEFTNKSVTTHRFVLRAVFDELISPLQNAAGSAAAAAQAQHQAGVLSITNTLLQAALDRESYAPTLVGGVLDTVPASPAAAMNAEFLRGIMNDQLHLNAMQVLRFAAALQANTARREVREAAIALLADLTLPVQDLQEKDGRWVRSISLLLKPSVQSMPKLEAQLHPLLDASASPAAELSSEAEANAPSLKELCCGRVSLSSILREVGTGCVTTVGDSKRLLSMLGRAFTEQDIADVLGFFATPSTSHSVNDSSAFRVLAAVFSPRSDSSMNNMSGGSASVVNARPLLDALQGFGEAAYDWDEVIRLLDDPNEGGFELNTIPIIFDAYHSFSRKTSRESYPPLSLFLGSWRNTSRQACALTYALLNPDQVTIKDVECTTPQEVQAAIEEDRSEAAIPARPASPIAASPTSANATRSAALAALNPMSAMTLWGSEKFMMAAVHVASRDARFDNDVLTPAVTAMPLLFLYVLLGSSQLRNSLKAFVILKDILAHHRPSLDRFTSLLIPCAEQEGNLDALIGLVSELTMSQPAATVDAVEMLLKVKPLTRVFQKCSSPRLVVAVAMCMEDASKADSWVNRALEGKLHFSVSSTENPFSVAMYVVDVAEMLLGRHRHKENASFALNAVLASPMKALMPTVVEHATSLLASTDSVFPREIEVEANNIFKEMYRDGRLAPALARIRELHDSTSHHCSRVYACVVNIVFEEVTAVSCYPPQELQLFGQLFGSLMVNDLFPTNQMQRAWGLLLSAIVKPNSQSVADYGIYALKELKPRLAEWPQYCKALRLVKDLDYRLPGVMATVHRGIREEIERRTKASSPTLADVPKTEAPGKAVFVDPAIVHASGGPAAAASSGTSNLHSLNIRALLADSCITSPPPVIQDQINFLLGNTDSKNVDKNAEELATQLRPEYYEFFAHYLVVKRAALEPNNHALYIDLVSKLKAPELEKVIRTATVTAVRRLLSSERISTFTSDEWTLLGNLGLWLGSITIKMDVPLLFTDLNFEDLLVQGLKEQRLAAAIMFMSRVLESCASSTFFAIPNPWSLAQLCIFHQVYETPHLRSRLRLEFDILLSKLKVELNTVQRYAAQYYPHRTRLRMGGTYTALGAALRAVNRSKHADFMVEGSDDGQPISGASTSPNPEAGRLGTSTLQPTAEPFQPGRPAAASASPPPVPLQPGATKRGAVELHRRRIVVPPELENFGLSTVDIQERVYRVLLEIVEDYIPLVEETAKRGAECATNLIRREWTPTLPTNEVQYCACCMARSLAANESYVTMMQQLKKKKSLEERILDIVYSSRGYHTSTSSSTSESEADLKEKARLGKACEGFIVNCEMLALRVVEYKAGNGAVMEVNRLLPLVFQSLNKSVVPQGSAHDRQVLLSFRDFHYCFPISNSFLHHLRVVEDTVNRMRSAAITAALTAATAAVSGTPAAAATTTAAASTAVTAAAPEQDGAGAATPPQEQEQPEQQQDQRPPSPEAQTVSPAPQHAQKFPCTEEEWATFYAKSETELMNMISPESAAYIAGPILQRLFNTLRLDSDKKREESSQPKSPLIHTATTQLWDLYMKVLLTCLRENEEGTRDEVSTMFLLQDGRYGFYELVVQLLRSQLISFERLDNDLEHLLQRKTKDSVSRFLTQAILTDRVITPVQVQRTLKAIALQNQNTGSDSLITPPLGCYSLLYMVHPETNQLFLPIEPAVATKENYQDIAAEFNKWIAAKSTARQQGRSSGSGTSHVQMWNNNYVQNLQTKGHFEYARLQEFFFCLICFCVEDYATRALFNERKNANTSHGVPGRLPINPWVPPPMNDSAYDSTVFTKCDHFSDMFQVLIRCVSIRPDEKTADQRGDVTLLRRALEIFCRVLPRHHAAYHSLDSWTAPKVRSPLPAHVGFIPVFQQQPYVRIFSNLLLHINSFKPDATLTQIFLNALRSITPLQLPGFAFGWLELVSHRVLLERTLSKYRPELWDAFAVLLSEALLFIRFTTQSEPLLPTGLLFFKAFVKLLFIIHHDFPHFFVAKNYFLYSITPHHHLQVLNLYNVRWMPSIEDLNANKAATAAAAAAGTTPASPPAPGTSLAGVPLYPIATVIADVVSANGFGNCMSVLENFTTVIQNNDVAEASSNAIVQPMVERFFGPSATPSPHNLLHVLMLHIFFVMMKVSPPLPTQPGEKVEVSRELAATPLVPMPTAVLHASAGMGFIRALCEKLNPATRFSLLHTCVHHLRDGQSAETRFFSDVLLHLFTTPSEVAALEKGDPKRTTQTAVQEQIIRTVLERYLAHSPRPEGVTITMDLLSQHPEFVEFSSFFQLLHLKGLLPALPKKAPAAAAAAAAAPPSPAAATTAAAAAAPAAAPAAAAA